MRDTIHDKNVVPFLQLGHDVIDETVQFDNANEKLAYIVIKRHATNGTRNAFPSLTTIAEKVGCSKRTAIRCVQSLVDKGLLLRLKQYNPDSKRYHANQYTIPKFVPSDTESHPSDTESHPSDMMSPPSDTVAPELYSFKDDEEEKNPLKTKEQAQKQAYLYIQDLYGKAGWGMPNGIITEQLLQDIQEYGKEIVGFAIETAAMNNARSYRYTQKLYTDWEQKGYRDLATIKQALSAEKTRKVPAASDPARDSFLLGE